MQIDAIIPFGQQKKTPTPTPTPAPTPTPSPTPAPTPTPSPTPTPAPTASPTPTPTTSPVTTPTPSAQPAPAAPSSNAETKPAAAVRITSMSDAVRQAVIDARTPDVAAKWIGYVPKGTPEADAEVVAFRSKAEILSDASQAMLAQANQTRESIRGLLDPGG